MITVIGAGPAGLRTAELMANAGKKVAVFEEDKRIGEPVQCTGIVTSEILKMVPIPRDIIVNRIRKARIYSKHRCITLPVDDLVLDRGAFDRYLANRAEQAGARIVMGQKIFKQPKAIVVGADGPASLTRKILNPKLNTHYLVGKQALVRGKFSEDTFEVYLGSVAPGFFAWVVPENDEYARIGIAAEKKVDIYFQAFVKKRGRIISHQAGLIPIFDRSIRVQRRNTYLVGDAAGQVKATTGGGLVPGLRAAEILANCIIKNRNYSAAIKRLYPELQSHYIIRQALDRFSDSEYDDLLLKLNRAGRAFRGRGRDSVIGLGTRILLRQPSLIKYAKKLL